MGMRNKCLVIVIISIFIMNACLLNEPFDAELSNEILFQFTEDLPILDDVRTIQVYKVSKPWPSYTELKQISTVFESSSKEEIVIWLSELTKHSDNVSLGTLTSTIVILIKMSDDRIAYIQVNIYSSGVFIMPIPSEDEIGSHGFQSRNFFKFLGRRGLLE